MVFSEALIIQWLDGFYGFISQMIWECEDKALQCILACRIQREMKKIINVWKELEPNKEQLQYYNGYLINNLKEQQMGEEVEQKTECT